jgi:CMP-N-acetylneuraminic acid synthetase
MKTIMALIPARGGSKRIPKKNIKDLFGHPLLSYTIETAKQSGIFKGIFVSTDCQETAEIARCYGSEVIDRPNEFATETSPDFEWVNYTLEKLGEEGRMNDCAMLLRPTNPFRKPESLARAWEEWTEFASKRGADSMRAIRRVKEHPAKMWWKIPGKVGERFILNYGYDPNRTIPKYERQYADLPEVFIQSAALEIFGTNVPKEHKNISGKLVWSFEFPRYEDFDLNSPEDWILAEELVKQGMVELPHISEGCPVCDKQISKAAGLCGPNELGFSL